MATFTLAMVRHLVELVSTLVLLVVLAAFLVACPWAYRDGVRAMLPRTWENGLQVAVTTLWIERRLHKRAPGEAPAPETPPPVH